MFKDLMQLNKILKSDNGQGTVEYALILLFVAIAVVGGLSTAGSAVGNVFQEISLRLSTLP